MTITAFREFEITETSYDSNSVNIDEIAIDDNIIKEHVTGAFDPEDIFEEKELQEWAENNGYIKEKE